MIVRWTDAAQNHLAAIHSYIAQNSPEYAHRTVDRLTKRTHQIAVYPKSGRVVPEYESSDLREIIEGSYRIIYRIFPEKIDVIAVLHCARNVLK